MPLRPRSGVPGHYETGDKTSAADPCYAGGAPPISGVESDTRAWYLNPAGGPWDANSVEERLRLGDSLLRQGHTQCPGYTGALNIPTNYKGRTTKNAEINSSAQCTANTFTRDGTNVVSFGPLPRTDTSAVLAATCRYIAPFLNEIMEADIRFQTDVGWFGFLVPECSNQFDIVGVMVHETGHAYGFGHVTEGNDPDAGSQANTTMSPMINGPCQPSERTLASGELSQMSTYY